MAEEDAEAEKKAERVTAMSYTLEDYRRDLKERALNNDDAGGYSQGFSRAGTGSEGSPLSRDSEGFPRRK